METAVHPFESLQNDTIFIENNDGNRTGPYRTTFSSKNGEHFANIFEQNLDVEEGWRAIRQLPKNKEEIYTVLEANYSSGLPGIPPHWSLRLRKSSSMPPLQKHISCNNKIFIVHGRDDHAKTEVARFVEKLGFQAIILHEQASGGNTIIEKIEEHTDVGFSIVLYTPCDRGGIEGGTQKSRARQNVVFEHGYLMGKLGRNRVCALVKDEVETPNDISGIVYTPLDQSGAWHIAVAKELHNAGYSVDMNKIIGP